MPLVRDIILGGNIVQSFLLFKPSSGYLFYKFTKTLALSSRVCFQYKHGMLLITDYVLYAAEMDIPIPLRGQHEHAYGLQWV